MIIFKVKRQKGSVYNIEGLLTWGRGVSQYDEQGHNDDYKIGEN